MDAGANAGCSSGDCEEEEQEDPSSSSFDVLDVCEDVADLNLQESNAEKSTGDGDLSRFRQQWQRELHTPETQDGPEKLVEDEEPAFDDDNLTEANNGRRSTLEYGYDELAAFRQQWQRELEATPTPQQEEGSQSEPEPVTEEERAKRFFLKAADLERSGKWYEAIQNYKRAMAIVPDIERRLYESTKGMETPQEEAEIIEEPRVNTNQDDDDDEEVVQGEEVVARLLRIQARRGIVCTPQLPLRGTHISCLPYEVIQVILRWVISSELDAVSLERAGQTCRALHIAARDPELWRAMCVSEEWNSLPESVFPVKYHPGVFKSRVNRYLLGKRATSSITSSLNIRTWGIECGTPRHHSALSWRDMYVSRPRLMLHGCYISKTTYLRHGETTFQDHHYRPWYLIDYYRYLRFFPEGVVLMLTTADEPAQCVPQLRYRHAKGVGVMAGHYRLIGDKVVIVIKKNNADKKQNQASTRFRARRKEVEQDQTQTFHMELEVRSVRGRRNAVLSWLRYRVCSRRDQWTQFELTPRSFPPFGFSRVRSYTQDSLAPL